MSWPILALRIAAVDDLIFDVEVDGRTFMRAIETTRTALHHAVAAEARSAHASRAALFLATALLALTGGLFTLACGSGRKVEPPLATPPLDLAVRYHAGTALEGPLATESTPPIDAAPEHVLAVRCRFVYLDRFQPEALTSLLQSARLVVADSGNQPLITRASRELGVRVGGDEPAVEFVHQLERGGFDRTVVAGELAEVLPEGVTLVVSCRERAQENPSRDRTVARPATNPDSVPLPPFALLLARGTGPHASAITALFAIVDSPLDEPGASAPIAERDRRRGVVLSESPLVDGAPLVVVIPARDDPVPTAALALVVEVSHPPKNAESAASIAQAVERCSSEIAKERTVAERSSKALSPEEASAEEMVCALEALEIARFHRSALAFLAKSSGAPLAESLALVAEAEPLRQYVERVIKACGGARALSRASPALGWKLESTAYLFLADVSLQDVIPPELAALLVRHAGEAGRYPDELESAVASSRDLAALQAQFVAQNRYALQDDRPASRVRAFDWLSPRGLAPAGYDPLGSERARHAALTRAEDALESASAHEDEPR